MSRYSWRYVFFINLPIGIGLIVLAMILLKRSDVISWPSIDIAGAFSFSGSILFFMLGINLAGENFSAPSLLFASIFFVLSFSFITFFFLHEKNESNPFLDIVLLKSRPFLAANLYNMIFGAAVFGMFSIVPLYATSVHKVSTMMSGVILSPRSVGVIPTSIMTSFLLKRWGYRWPMVAGAIIISLSTMLLGQDLHFWSVMGLHLGIAEILAFLVLFSGIGAGFANPASNNACIELMPAKVATIIGLRNVSRTVGGALGISVISLILHLSSNPATGFRISFISFGLEVLLAIPLVFLMPAGKKERG